MSGLRLTLSFVLLFACLPINISFQTEKSFGIDVLNVNEAPISVSLLSSGASQTFLQDQPEVNENCPLQTVVATVQGTTLIGNLANGLRVSGSSANLQLGADSITSWNNDGAGVRTNLFDAVGVISLTNSDITLNQNRGVYNSISSGAAALQ